MTFTVKGPFLVADLTQNKELYESIPVGSHGEEEVKKKEKTKEHKHTFLSLYKSKALDLFYGDVYISLPERALTLVLPGVKHSWVSKRNCGDVSSVDTRHRKQVIQPLMSV
ncbi:MAG: hypothetical protein COV59_03870 [Candidatus Magasanikbacteria bacterium CG11_big_fil_rev_8_21_14_0_20_39_34]|uniref:AraC-type arabinose-binding/dimerisation domain-containing protein n=1 Tax=Candidatus Magasanikbacteria bacterium CG11_big_fil_rev_8_21_14_0_20_39_34 TaxID=1974653 RepID=A0A2H0N4G7_9BACT|nr:MAG: hypothetical protein COV59_03870 [Candidatus Magasanikbacteria bacterium CG11_big_fil_rev_8_21_14_0_20_39_34]